MSETKVKEGYEWSEDFKQTPRVAKINGDFVALGRDEVKLSNGKVVTGPKTKAEWEFIKSKFPTAFASDTGKSKRFGLK